METQKMKNFVQLQCCMLLLLLTVLPEFKFSSLFGLPDLNVPVFICKIVGLVGGGLALKNLYEMEQKEGRELSMPFLIASGTGMGLVLLAMIPGIPSWLEYIALVALIVALFLSKKSLNIQWANASIGGAYIILLAVLLHIYAGVNDIWAVRIAALAGLIMYLVGLSRLRSVLDPAGIQGASKLKIAVILGLVATVIGWIPLIGGILGGIIAIVAFIIEFLGYGCLKSSATIGAKGQSGAGKLRLSMIIALVGVVLGWIPVAGDMLQGILSIIVILLVFQGWSGILFGLNSQNNEN